MEPLLPIRSGLLEVGGHATSSGPKAKGASAANNGATTTTTLNKKKIEIHYELFGDGPNKVILITGLSAHAHSWDTTVRFLLATGDYQICIFDNRDMPPSSEVGPEYTIKDMAWDVHDLMHHLGWTKNVFVAGVSMGGMITQELILLCNPGTFATAALISTHAGLTIPKFKSALIFLAGELKGSKQTQEEKVERIMTLVFAPKWLRAKPQLPALEATYKTNRDMIMASIMKQDNDHGIQSVKSRSGQVNAITRHYVSPDRLSLIGERVPTLEVYVGTEDILIRPSNSAHIAKHTKAAAFHILPGAGHAIMIEAPYTFHKLLIHQFENAPGFVSRSDDAGSKKRELFPFVVKHADGKVVMKHEDEAAAAGTEPVEAQDALVEATPAVVNKAANELRAEVLQVAESEAREVEEEDKASAIGVAPAAEAPKTVVEAN